MKLRVVLIIGIVVLLPIISLAEVTRKVTEKHANGNPKEIFFYSDGKKLAQETWDEAMHTVTLKGHIPDGMVREYYDDGGLRGEWTFKLNQRNGEAKTFYETGQLESVSNWEQNKKHGILKGYYKSANLRSKYVFDGGEAVTGRAYYESGRDLAQVKAEDDGRVLRRWYESGQLKLVCPLEGSRGLKLHGVKKEYYETGQLKMTSCWKNNESDGQCISYYENGCVENIWSFKDGKLDGWSVSFDSAGELLSTQHQKADKTDGQSLRSCWRSYCDFSAKTVNSSGAEGRRASRDAVFRRDGLP